MKCVFEYIIIIASAISLSNGLECYSCNEQDGNGGKCKQNVMHCAAGEDHCLSTVKWGSTPYFTDQGAPKQYFISKQCATKELCKQKKEETFPRCDRISYNDWECVECCQGDKCNFYVTLGSAYVKCSWMVICSAIILCIVHYKRFCAV